MAISENEEFEFRARAEAEGAGVPFVSPKQKKQMSLGGLRENLKADISGNIRGAVEAASYNFPPLTIMKGIQGENVYDPSRLMATSRGMIQGLKEIPSTLAREVSHPIESMYERPLSTALDLGSLVSGGVGLAKLGATATRATARKVLPGIVRGTAGIPEAATEIALKKPSVLSVPPVAEGELNRVVGEPLIKAIQETKRGIGERFGKIYKRYAGMEGPMQDIIDTPIAQKLRVVEKEVPTVKNKTITELDPFTRAPIKRRVNVTETKTIEKRLPGDLIDVPRKTHSYDDILVNKNLANEAFAKGDKQALDYLYKEYIGTPKSNLKQINISPKDELQILTRLKREVQQQADFNKAPITLKPIDTAKDAAFKKIASDIDALRSDLPGGKALAQVDDAWKSLNDIYDTIRKDLSDPGKARDTMMRLLRGDNTWLTSGKYKVKTDAIKRVESLTGKKLLEPAMEELTRQVFSQNLGKGFFANMTKTAAAGLGALGIGTANPAALISSGALLGASSPRVVGAGIKAASKIGAAISKAVPFAEKAALGGVIPILKKTLTEAKAKEFLKKSKNNRDKARKMAQDEGYEIPLVD